MEPVEERTPPEPAAPVDFIRQIIDEDLAAGKNHGRLATRFPPEPNGYLHIGHAKSICLNFGVVAERGGTCNLRFDDTNPVKEDVEYVESIKRDVEWLGFKWDALLYASDYWEQLYQFAIQLINKGLAYVDELTADQIREYRGTLTDLEVRRRLFRQNRYRQTQRASRRRATAGPRSLLSSSNAHDSWFACFAKKGQISEMRLSNSCGLR